MKASLTCLAELIILRYCELHSQISTNEYALIMESCFKNEETLLNNCRLVCGEQTLSIFCDVARELSETCYCYTYEILECSTENDALLYINHARISVNAAQVLLNYAKVYFKDQVSLFDSCFRSAKENMQLLLNTFCKTWKVQYKIKTALPK